MCAGISSSPHYFYSLRVSAVLDHFRYPAPHPRSMATVHLVRPGSHPRHITSDAYSPFTRPSRNRQSSIGPSHLLPLAGQLQCRSALIMGGNSLRPRKVRAQPPVLRALGPPCPWRLLLLKRRKRKEGSTSLSSKMVSPPEKKRKIISESPDSQAEGPFCDSDTVSVPEDSPHAA